MELVEKIKNRFANLGIETPMVATLDDTDKRSRLESVYAEAHRIMGLDLNDDSISETPRRIAKLMLNDSMSGLDYNNFPKCTVIENKFYRGLVTVNDLMIYSLCEHHWERVLMRVSVSYITNRKVLGLSKFSRIAEFFGARPIVQERFTTQLHEALKVILETEDVAVHVRGLHLCMFARGVEEPCSSTTTSILGGEYMHNEATRLEFLKTIDVSKPLIPT